MAIVSLTHVTLSFGDDPILDGVDVHFEMGERVCLLGRNGAGKTSLLRLLEGDLSVDSGRLDFKPSLRVSSLPQSLPENFSGTIYEVLTDGLGTDSDLLKQYHQLNEALEFEATDEQLKKLEQLQHQLESQGAWEGHIEVEKILTRLALSPDTRVEELSVGMKRRVLLGRALVSKPELLLLDEPTNHLDLVAVKWLEDLLLSFQGTVVFVSHDRSFIHKLSTRILELDRGNVHNWRCDYPTYLERKKEQLEAEEAQQKEFEKKLAQEEHWVRQGIKARGVRDQGRVRRLMEMREVAENRRKIASTANIQAAEGNRSGNRVIQAENVTFSFDKEKPLIKDFSVEVYRGEKIALVGPNGVGKTTLLRVLLGELEADSGKIKLGANLELSYLDQLHGELDPDASVLDNVAQGNDTLDIGGKSVHSLAYLQQFLFTPIQARGKLAHLSGGEKNRVALARLFTIPSNVLVLDEPTNDLDIETLEQLEDLVLNYSGTVLIVSHDRTFIDNVATSTWYFEGDGRVNEYFGGYKELLIQRPDLKEGSNPVKSSTPKRKKAPSENDSLHDLNKTDQDEPPKKKLSYKEQREFEALPQKLEDLEKKQAELHEAMSDPELYQQGGSKIAELKAELDVVEQEIEVSYERWVELEDRAG